MRWLRNRNHSYRGSAPATPGFSAVAPECLPARAAVDAAPAIPAPESTLGSHPCLALSSAQVLPEWITLISSSIAFTANGDYPLNFVSHSRGSLHEFGERRLLWGFSCHTQYLWWRVKSMLSARHGARWQDC
jgi:hypothetical protein